MKRRLCGGKVLRRNHNRYELCEEDLFCDEGKIAEYNHLIHYQEIDMSGKCILPPFFNMHSHLGETLFYDSVSGNHWTLEKYLSHTGNINASMDKVEREEFWENSAVLAAEQMKKEGTAGFCAARSAGIADKYDLLTMSGYPIMNSEKLAEYKINGLSKFQENYSEYSSEKCSVGVFLHSVYANDEASFNLAVDCMKNGAEYLTVHVSEDYDSYLLEKQKYGISAIKVLDNYGLLNENTILVHCGYCTEEDFDLIKERRAVVCVCPISNRFLNTKMPDLYMLEEKNIPWCIASDGLATGRTFSLLEQVKEAKKEFPLISNERFMDSITYTPGRIFQKESYDGTLNAGVNSTLLIVDYETEDTEELMRELIYGNVKFQLIKY